jgi:hypothetical protein
MAYNVYRTIRGYDVRGPDAHGREAHLRSRLNKETKQCL